ncbi:MULTISPECIES: aminoglycoside phosphotransferase family protein [Streptomyces]|uniref:phosphotransferase enzyme family protein n=1 Tax=Streptomyces TaxID=1883 RepID=UPI00240D2FC9|nr:MULTISPECIES: aminoglycoside phosphotransferase family protein [Streptomyces]WFB85847.1 aminoglycoside phosphotransferase family protein [Streptomyces olivaceus]WGK48526.1 aminoglycoside phosphotransferase family protein [Streptomyces sp. B146]
MISGSDGQAGDGDVEFTADGVSVVLREACETAGLDPTGAELLRLGSNAVYRLATAPVIVRIARDPSVLAEMERAVGVARWLETVDFPATRVLSDVTQPSLVRGRVVTFWESVQDQVEYATVGELADLLRRFHWLEEPESLGLPYFDPLAKLSSSLESLTAVSAEDRTFLEERAARLAKDYDRLDFVLPFGLIHGDANIGNVLRHRDGRAVLIDLDGLVLAPREWDLILTAIYYDRYGWHSKTEYAEFVHRYGFDLMNWPGYETLADLRELMMVVWIGHQAGTSDRFAAEFELRMRSLRTGEGRHAWGAF